ncbi:MAG: hypothetical protein JXB23_14095 [Candidatus Aminicenantes bacterium]|nr:hypothetical protein [Candidatus Aminicenantes bacterium]
MTAPALYAEDIPKVEYPVLTTSAGQSTDVETLNIIAEEAGIKYDYCDVPTAAILKDGVGLGGRESADTGFHAEIHTDLAKYPRGTPYKTIIFAIGASLKGMGASGLTIEDEVKRLKEVIDYCKKNKIFIIALHIGGVSKRGAPGGDNERMIDTVAPYADYIISAKDSNKDGRFSSIAQEKGIPYTEVEYALGVVDILKTAFQ